MIEVGTARCAVRTPQRGVPTISLFFASCAQCSAKIADELLVFALARCLIRLSKKRRWMNSRKDPGRKFGRQYFAPLARDPKRRAENRLRCRRAQGHYQLWLNDSYLRFQPRAAGGSLARIWFLMDTSFPARLPLKMFHGVRHINLGPINSSFFERSIHYFPSGSNERFTGDILIISRLFAHEHDKGVLWTFAEYSLRCALVKVTRLAIFRRLAHGRPARCVGRLCRTGELLLLIRSHVPVKNRKSATL